MTDGPTFEVDIHVVDVAVSWMREDHNGKPLPEIDWRFHVTFPSGSRVTFNRDATAEEVASYLLRAGAARREGLSPVGGHWQRKALQDIRRLEENPDELADYRDEARQ